MLASWLASLHMNREKCRLKYIEERGLDERCRTEEKKELTSNRGDIAGLRVEEDKEDEGEVGTLLFAGLPPRGCMVLMWFC